MKHPLLLALTALLLAPLAVLLGGELPKPASPAAGEIMYSPHPHFHWQREMDVKIDEVHRIQIARDEAFAEVVCDDRVEVVSRFVPVKPLLPARYWWRVRRGEGEWSKAAAFEVRTPEHGFTIPAGSDAVTLARVIQDAAAHCPAQVNFEPDEYNFAPTAKKSLVTLAHIHDLIIDGHGARLVLAGTFLSLTDGQRVTIQHFTVTADRPGHTLVRILKKGDENLVVKPEPGYDPDVRRFFHIEGTGGSFAGGMDPQHHGKYIPGAGLSARNVNIAPAPNEPGAFLFSPVNKATLDLMPLGAVAVVTAYHWQWVQMNRTDECTFSDVTVVDLPGAFCGGSDNSAKSYLACKVKRRSPKDYFGGHSACGSGRIGEWVEGCEFECLPDDGPAEQSFRQPIKGDDGADAILLAKNQAARAVRAGDHIALVNPKTRGGSAATVLAVKESATAVRVQLDRPLAALAAALGHNAAPDWSGVFLYCDAPSNEDFVYRRNRHVGGRGHGVKFNGTRAWIADNHFENINGNAVLAGYTSEVSGHGARDVVVSGNTIVRCGWTPIEAHSTSGLGGNIIIRDNRITETRDAAVAIQGCDGVTVINNEFASSTPPKQGAWILSEKTARVVATNNRFPTHTVELKPSLNR